MTSSKILRLAAGLALVSIALVGCGDKATEKFRDAPRGSSTNKAPADVITMPDGFSNVAHKCDGPNMVYVIFHEDAAYGSVAVAPNDPRCADSTNSEN